MNNISIPDAIITYIVFLYSTVAHEAAHAWTAWRVGCGLGERAVQPAMGASLPAAIGSHGDGGSSVESGALADCGDGNSGGHRGGGGFGCAHPQLGAHVGV